MPDESTEEARRLFEGMIANAPDGTYSITAIARDPEDSDIRGLFAQCAAVAVGEDVSLTGDSLSCVIIVERSLRSLEGGYLTLARLDSPDGVPHVAAWRLLAGEAVPMSAEETRTLHAKEIGGTAAMPEPLIRCIDAYLIPEEIA